MGYFKGIKVDNKRWWKTKWVRTCLVQLGSRDAGGNEVDVGAGAHVKNELLPVAHLDEEAGCNLFGKHTVVRYDFGQTQLPQFLAGRQACQH